MFLIFRGIENEKKEGKTEIKKMKKVKSSLSEMKKEIKSQDMKMKKDKKVVKSMY